MVAEVEKHPIQLGDAVSVVMAQGCKTVHPTNILGVVRKIYYDSERTDRATSYGVEANGEIIFYLTDQICKVPNVKVEDPDTDTILNTWIAQDMIDNALYNSALEPFVRRATPCAAP